MNRRILVLIFCLSCLAASACGYKSGPNGLSGTDALTLCRPKIESEIDPGYMQKNIGNFVMTIGIAYVPDDGKRGFGRLWNCVVGGGDNANAYFLLNWSDDGGLSWTDTKFVIDPHGGYPGIPRRTIVGNLWTAPDGKLWLFFDQSVSYFDGMSSNWCSVCGNPLDDNPEWSRPVHIGFGCSLQRPTVMSTGEWVLPVSLWDRKRITDARFSEAHHDLDGVRGAHCFVSVDEGATWEDRSFLNTESPRFDEHCFVELKNEADPSAPVWWVTARSASSEIQQAFSYDRGRTWKTTRNPLAAIMRYRTLVRCLLTMVMSF